MSSRDKPATKANLDDGLGKLEAKLREELAEKLDNLKTELRGELKERETRLVGEMIRRFEKTASKDDFSVLKAGQDRILKLLDHVAGRLRDQDKTVLTFDDILKTHRKQLADHENRLTTLESKPA